MAISSSDAPPSSPLADSLIVPPSVDMELPSDMYRYVFLSYGVRRSAFVLLGCFVAPAIHLASQG